MAQVVRRPGHVSLFPRWFLWFYWQLGIAFSDTTPVWSGDTSHEASSRRRPCDGWAEERWRAGWARVRVWKWIQTLKPNTCPFCSLFSTTWFFCLLSFLFYFPSTPQTRLKVLSPLSLSHMHSLVSAGFFALTFSSHPFPSLSVVFHCGLMRGTWRTAPPHLFVCLWESYFLSTEGFWAADFLFSPDERQMFCNPLSLFFSQFLGFSKIWWLKAAWYQSKNDIRAFYFSGFFKFPGSYKGFVVHMHRCMHVYRRTML